MTNKPDLKILENARKKYLAHDFPFLAAARKAAEFHKLYKGVKILHNIPLTIDAVFKIEVLVTGGADVTATCIKTVPPRKEAIKILEEANIKVQLDHNFNDKYDIHLDCCAELISLKEPQYGAVELTQTGSNIYRNAYTSYPVISIDDSKIKFLETIYGTGDGFVRALIAHTGENIEDKSFVLFGFGKVGRGIVYSLKKYTKNITVIDFEDYRKDQEIQFINCKDFSKIKKVIKNSYCCVTATGVKNVISGFYGLDKSDFNKAILMNMGAEDEYGENFSLQDVVFEKSPINFSLSEPTARKYLDPILYAHNLGVDLILSKQLPNGYNPFPNSLATEILKKWQSIYKEKMVVA